MTLNVQEQILVEQRVSNEAKSIWLAYLFMFIFGGLGVYLFYLGRIVTGIAMLGMTFLGLFLIFASDRPILGLIALMVVSLWWFIDLFFVPGFVASHRQSLRDKFSTQINS